jgi:hypothetical protein
MAFDPAFVEIRHVEDGSLVQVIRGNNLRCLFADIQPSVMNCSASTSSSIRTVFRYDPSEVQSGQPVHGHVPDMATHPQQQHKPRRAHERDEIILASDDKVMAVRPAAPPPRKSDASAVKA